MTEGQHAAPEPWWRRWQETEPLRLHVYGVLLPLGGVALVYGWLTAEQLGAWLAALAALLLGTGAATELAHRRVWSPASVDAVLDEQHRDSYAQGVEDAVHATPDATALMRQVRPAERCRHIEDGRRCVLDDHGKGTPHHYG